MRSIRRRLLLVLAIGFVALIAAAVLAADRLLAGGLTAEFDEALIAKARTLATLTEQDDGRIDFDYEGAFLPEFERAERPHYFELRFADGPAIERSTRLPAGFAFPSGGDGPLAVQDVALPDGRPGRAVRMRFRPRHAGEEGEGAAPEPPAGAPRLVLVVARDRLDLDGRIRHLRLTILAGGLAAALLGAALVWRALRSGFRPLSTIAGQVAALDADSLGTRIALPGARPPRELAPIVEQLNALLERLEASFRRERRFAGNVAHELRTPIAELRTLAEVGARWPDDEDAARAFFRDAAGIAGRMDRVVSSLLLLARCQAGVEATTPGPVPLRAALEQAWERRAAGGTLEGRSLALDVPAALQVESDPDKLPMLLDNLIDNAVSHSPPGSAIRCEAEGEGGRWRLTLTNPSGPLDGDDLASLTAPFWRKDESRSSEEHSGLGLSLVAAIAGLLDLEIAFRQGPDGLFEARVEGGVRRPA